MRHLLVLATIPALIACADAQSQTEAAETSPTTEAETVAMEEASPAIDLSALPAGTYIDEDGHAYIQFSYDHLGYSRPILRWGEFEATVNYDSENPENSSLNVVIPVASIDTNVTAFDEHLKSADFFDAENHPTITFESTSVDIGSDGTGTVTGDLTIKDITRSISFEGQINKIGQHFQSEKDMFGISGTGKLKRSDFGVGAYAPNVGDEVELVLEVEFQKQD